MSMNEHTDRYIPLIEEGMSYEEIRTLAIKNGVKGKDLSALMRELDRYILEREEVSADRRQAKESMWIGIAFCAIAGMMSLYALMESEGHYIYMVYCVFGGGVLVFYNGLEKKKYLEKEKEEDL